MSIVLLLFIVSRSLMTLREAYDRTFQQISEQKLPGLYMKQRPALSYKTLLALGIFNLFLGAYSLFVYTSLSVSSIPYSNDVQTTIFLPKGTSHIYIGLEGVYQNYLSYTKSINYNQLEGKTQNINLSNTKPFDFLDNLPYYPAGAIAATYFQDQIAIDGLEIQTENLVRNRELDLIGITGYSADEIAIPENWTPETNENTIPLNTVEGSELPILNERFVNWINLSAFPYFKKFWGIVDVETAGEYNLTVDSTYEFASKKEIYIAEKSILGLPNYRAVVTMFTIGILSVLGSIYLNRRGY